MKLGRLAEAVSLLVLGGASACTPYSTFKNLPLDCDVESRYELQSIDTFEMLGATPGWTAADGSGGAVMTGGVETIPDGARCGSSTALVIRGVGNNDWGSLFGFNNFGPRDASAYEGLAFWARAPGSSNKSLTVLFDDPNTAVPPTTTDANCKDYGIDGGTGTGTVDPGSGMVIPGSVTDAPEPDQCGNSYGVIRVVTMDWRFYTVPFALFQQGHTPNRVPNEALMETGATPGTTLLTSQILNLILRMPKAVATELWIDNLSFYRQPSATGGDGGVDAPQM
jgi:hypothetical protein